jgi:sugar O-acyltransferase (sialic acid O-acetyltransferase NeuD family)
MIYLLGSGAMARETFQIYDDLGKSKIICGFIEENSKKRKSKSIRGKSIMDSSIINTLPKDSIFIGAIGTPLRKRWINEIETDSFVFDTVIHPSVMLGSFVKIGSGCIVCQGTIMTCDINIGQHTIINIGCTISHDCEIGDFVTICPGVNIGGNVRISDGCWIGIGTKIINEVSIGKGSFIGAGSVVTENIPENVLAIGVPAKPINTINNSDWEKLI